jgi:tetratricopeptide (TPR) repeat protein
MRPLLLMIAASALLLAGCAPQEKIPASEPTPIPIIIPLPRLVEDRPSPENTLGLDVAETAQADKPNDPKANLALGYSYYKARSYADAARAFDKASRLAPKDPTPLLYLGYTQMAVGALDKALVTFQAVAEMPGATNATKSEAYLQLGTIQGAFNDIDSAISFFEKSLKANPKQGAAMLALGARAAEEKRTSEAQKFFTDAIALLPDGRQKSAGLAGLAKITERKGKTQEALALYKQAVAMDDENIFAADGVKRLTVK